MTQSKADRGVWVTRGTGVGRTAGRRRRGAIGVAALCASLAVLALSASPVLGSRTFDSQIDGFNSASSVAFDSNGDVWISDAGHSYPGNPGGNGIYKYDPYPSQTLLDVPSSFAAWGFASLGLQLAVDQSNSEVFVSQYNGREVDIFAPDSASNPCEPGVTFCFSHSWTTINGSRGFDPGIHVAIDNSSSYSRGRVYLSLAKPENDVEALDADQRPVDFPATAGYIKDNKLTGTPSG